MSVASILQALAENAGQAQLRQGAIYGNLVADASQLPLRINADQERQRATAVANARVQQQMDLERSRAAREDQLASHQDAADAKAALTEQYLSAIIGAGFQADPKTFDQGAAVSKAQELGRADLIPTIAAVHEKFTRKLTSGAPGSVMRDEAGQVVPGSEIPEKKTDYTINGRRFRGDGTPIGEVQPTQTTKSIESKSVLLDGKSALVNFNPATGAHTLPDGTDVSSRVKPIPPAAVQVLNQMGGPGGDASLGEKAIGDYKVAPPSARSLATPAGKAMMDRILAYNPDYDASLFTNRAPTRKAFTTGTQGQQINAINTAIGHIDQLTTLVDQLGNTSVIPVNQIMNFGRTMFGSDKVTNFDTLKDALAGEVSSVLSKGNATVSGIKDAQEKIKGASSPQQLAGYVKTLIPVMGSKLNELDYQYHQAMGKNDPFTALSPDSQAILAKHGFDPAHPTIVPSGGAKTPDLKGLTPGHGRTFTDGPYKGQTWTVGADGNPVKVSGD